MGRIMAMLVVFLLALVLTATKAAATIECMSVASNIMPCSNFLRDPKMTAPGSDCCNAARNLVRLGDVDSLCKCLSPFSSGFLSSKAKMLPALCNVASFSPLVPCLAPSSAMPESFLPPLATPFPPFPLTPVFPFPPFIPFPSFTPPHPPPPPSHKA